MIIPSRKLVLLLLLPSILLLVPVPAVQALGLLADLGIVIFAIVDWLVSPRPGRDVVVTREPVGQLSLGDWNQLSWEVTNKSSRVVRFWLTEDLPPELEKEDDQLEGRLAPASQAEISTTVRPTKRGLYERGTIHLRLQSLMGMLLLQKKLEGSQPVKVYPNAANLARYELAVRRHRLSEMGISAARNRGRGSIFESLRDYVPGDEPADMAWKATARRGRPITRNYEADRSQNLVLVLDCGRLMTTRLDEMSRLDYAINASVLLTYVAMKQGDYVGMLAFANGVQSYLPPIKGQKALKQMNEALYRIEPQLVEPDYEAACRFLSLQHRKRSMIVVFTDVISSDASSTLVSYLTRFARRHLPVCVTLRNLEVEALAAAEPRTVDDPYTQATAIEMTTRRREALQRLRSGGVDILDVDPRQMTPRVLDRYLLLKQRRRL